MSDTSAHTLRDQIAGWHPEPVVETDVLDPAPADRLAATLDLDETFGDTDPLPVGWQWIYFPDWSATADLGVDGHPADGHFLPPIADRRRMFAGSRISAPAPLRLGIATQKRSSLAAVTEKHGRSGDMLFVTLRSEYVQAGLDEPSLIEEQDLVYRSDSGHTRPFNRASTQRAAGASGWSAGWSQEPEVTSTLLFRYSALTSNPHRIHYDQPYATQVEGYPDVVIHGPLLATYMAELVRREHDGHSLRHFEFRLTRPLFLGDRFRVEARTVDDGSIVMRVASGADTVHASAIGSF